MTNFKSIRCRLGLSQSAIGKAIGVTQGSISFYENGKMVPPDVASKLIKFAKARGHSITFDDIYKVERSRAKAAA